MVTNLDLFIAQLRSSHESGSLDFSRSKPNFQEFVRTVPASDRVPLLLETYDRYRAIGSGCALPSLQSYFESSAYSLLISALLDSKLKPTEAEACAILTRSVHYCGHGGDVETPLELAEKAWEGKPYTPALFDAVRAYQAVLKGTTSTTAQNVKRKLQWILWHDPKQMEKKCWTARIQADLSAMPPDRAFAWQWLLRNTTATMNVGAGKAWLKEGEKRLAAVGSEEFLRHLDAWLTFPADVKVALSPAGSCVLRLLVWYASLLDPALPIVARLADVEWEKADPAKKVQGAVAWLLEQHEAYKETANRLRLELDGPVIHASRNPVNPAMGDLIAALLGAVRELQR